MMARGRDNLAFLRRGTGGVVYYLYLHVDGEASRCGTRAAPGIIF